jgi:hypothetical protein
MQFITNSTDWLAIETVLLNNSIGLKYERELKRMVSNIHNTVTALSKEEVEGRRNRVSGSEKLLIQINNDINIVEEFIIVAALLG